jgi:hypothetical protein
MKPVFFRLVLAAAWLNLAILTADGIYNVVKAVLNQFAQSGPGYF